jgi:hypothetical protein
MPVEVRGALELRKAIKKFSPDLAKETRKELANLLAPIVKTARGFVPNTSPLSGWSKAPTTTGRFPIWDSGAAKGGIGYKTSPSKPNNQGFKSIARIVNNSAAGAIYEWAGRINPEGLPWVGPKGDPNNRKVSHSRNPGAGKNFINILDGKDGYRQIHGKKDGRLILRAVEKDQGKFRRNIISGVERAMVRCQERMNITDTFGGSNG